MLGNSVVLLSGGIDSAACAQYLRNSGSTVRCVFVDYGQAGSRIERDCANRIADLLNLELSCVEVNTARRFGSGEIIGRNAFLILTALMTNRNNIWICRFRDSFGNKIL